MGATLKEKVDGIEQTILMNLGAKENLKPEEFELAKRELRNKIIQPPILYPREENREIDEILIKKHRKI